MFSTFKSFLINIKTLSRSLPFTRGSMEHAAFQITASAVPAMDREGRKVIGQVLDDSSPQQFPRGLMSRESLNPLSEFRSTQTCCQAINNGMGSRRRRLVVVDQFSMSPDSIGRTQALGTAYVRFSIETNGRNECTTWKGNGPYDEGIFHTYKMGNRNDNVDQHCAQVATTTVRTTYNKLF